MAKIQASNLKEASFPSTNTTHPKTLLAILHFGSNQLQLWQKARFFSNLRNKFLFVKQNQMENTYCGPDFSQENFNTTLTWPFFSGTVVLTTGIIRPTQFPTFLLNCCSIKCKSGPEKFVLSQLVNSWPLFEVNGHLIELPILFWQTFGRNE